MKRNDATIAAAASGKLYPFAVNCLGYYSQVQTQRQVCQNKCMSIIHCTPWKTSQVKCWVILLGSIKPCVVPMVNTIPWCALKVMLYLRAYTTLLVSHSLYVKCTGFRLVNEQAMSIVKQWRKIKHANIVSIREAFTTRAFGDSCKCAGSKSSIFLLNSTTTTALVFVYDYHPCSITLYEAYFSPQAQALLHARCQAAGGIINGMSVPETTLWSFITQLASALKTIHSAGLSARTMEPTKIIMTSKNRLRINCAGLVDVLQFDTTTAQQQRGAMHQQEDLLGFGQLIVRLACNTPTLVASTTTTTTMPPASFDYMSRFYSPDLKNVAYYLLGKPALSKSIDEVFTLIGPRVLHELNSSQ